MLKDKEILKRAKDIKAIRGHHYLVVENIATSNLLCVEKSRFKASKLKKIGEYEAQISMGYKQFFRPTAKEVLSDMPEELAKTAAAYKVLTKGVKLNPFVFTESAPAKVAVYAFKEGFAHPEEISKQSISLWGDEYSPEEIEKL